MLGQKNCNKSQGSLWRFPFVRLPKYSASRPPFSSHSSFSGRTTYLPFASHLPLACTALLALLLFFMLCPVTSEPVEAVANTSTEYYPSSVVLTMASNVSATVEPSASGTFQKMSAAIGVQVASADAFNITLRGDTEMSGSAGNPAKIRPVAAGTMENSFGKNTWGYSWAEGGTASGVYNPVPAEETTLVTQDTDNYQANKTYTLGFGAKVDMTLPIDTYTSSVTVSVVATPKTIVVNNYSITYDANEGQGTVPSAQTAKRQEASWSFTAASGASLSREGYEFMGWNSNPNATTVEYKVGATINLTATEPEKTLYAVWKATGPFGGITTMQGMTSAACKDAKYGETARLEDTRDGKKYWVTKLADGNCWMTQNLDLDLTTAGLTTEKSNVNWNSSSQYPPEATTTGLTNNSTATNTKSWDQGMYVYNEPTASASCGTGLSGISACTGGAANSGKTFINVGTGYTASTDPDFTAKNGSPVNTSTKEYDAHYLIGNYYSYNAATAGTGAAVTTNGANATGDICPKGWQLPKAGSANESSGTSFYELLTKQGMSITAGDDKSTSISGSAANAYTFLNASKITTPVSVLTEGGKTPALGTSQTINTALTTAPLFFVRSGYVRSDSALYVPGLSAYYLSRSSYSSTHALYLEFNNSIIVPANDHRRYFGHPLRCLYVPE